MCDKMYYIANMRSFCSVKEKHYIHVGGNTVRLSYNKLWKLLIDKGMNRQDLKRITGVSTSCIAKLGKGENVMTDVLLRICCALNCDISDIVECVPAGVPSQAGEEEA